MVEYVASRIQNSDCILVGLGEEVDLLQQAKNSEKYLRLIKELKAKWLISFIEKALILEMQDDRLSIYQKLESCLKGKNYFVVSVCQDGLINQTDLLPEKVVTPCGSYEKLQCSQKCTVDLMQIPDSLTKQINDLISGRIKEEEISEPVCPICGEPLVFNNVSATNYVEEGYLTQWQVYTDWLQRTLNKQTCILELGVGMKYPTVIRWPFEKITFVNQKAELFRVHSRLYQISEETKDKAHGICQSPLDFIEEIAAVTNKNCLFHANVIN